MKLTKYIIYFLCLGFIGLWFTVPMLQAEINQQSAAQSVAPTLTRVEPDNDMVTGGANVRIIGENFQDGATVTIGGNAASNVIFDSPTELIVDVPAGTAGSADVVVTNPGGQSSTLVGGFTYIELSPILTRVEPDEDMVDGGANVRIIGENFQDGATVIIGGNAASNVIFVSPTELAVEAPMGTAGSADVVVTNPDDQSSTLAGGFTYTELPPPTLTRVEPDNDVVTGGATIKIIGENFQDGATVTIGGNAASNVIFVSPTELEVEAPAGVAGSVDVVVTNPDGKSDTLAGGFTYTPLPPTLTRVEPDNDMVTGGANVQIIGENFQDGATVTIGGNAASNVIFVSPTELEVEAPAGVAGSVDVVVTNPDGKSDTLAGGFTYIELSPILTRVEPDEDMVDGGANVRIIGENFQDGATVIIGGNAASNVIFVSPTELEVEAPAGVAGSVDVVVTNPDGKSDTLAGGFTYTPLPPTLTRVEPDNDMVTGGANVQIIGENFQDGATVTIGGNAASNVIFVSPTELEVEAPAGTAGSVDVVVTNPDGKSDTLAGGFTYTPSPYDVTEDGVVNILDLVRVASQFGNTGAGLPEDINGDGVINILDLVAVANRFSQE